MDNDSVLFAFGRTALNLLPMNHSATTPGKCTGPAFSYNHNETAAQCIPPTATLKINAPKKELIATKNEPQPLQPSCHFN